MSSNIIKFVHVDQIVEVKNPDPNETLLNYIRTNLKKTAPIFKQTRRLEFEREFAKYMYIYKSTYMRIEVGGLAGLAGAGAFEVKIKPITDTKIQF